VGDVQGRAPLIVDDLISTGGTIEAAVKALLQARCAPEITVVASHALLVGPAIERLRDPTVRRLIVTDSVAVLPETPLPLQIAGLGPLLADAIERLHDNQSLSDMLVHA